MRPKNQGRQQARLNCELLENRLVLDNTSFVTNLYHDVLNRTADSGGLSSWVSQLNNGTMTKLQVATDFWQSTEHYSDEVDSYYETYLHRAPDNTGQPYWVGQLKAGVGERYVIEQFVTSQEFLNANNTPSLYITALYLDILQRQPADSEINYWEGVLAQTDIQQVATGIITAREDDLLVINSYYQNYLGRDGNQDPNGQGFWLAQLEANPPTGTVASVAEGFLGSQEYYNLPVKS